MKSRILIAVLVLAGWSCHAPDSAHAAVVVLANKTDRDVHFADISVSGQSRDYTLSAGEVLPLPVRGTIAIILSTESGLRRFELKSNTVYCFLGSPKRLELKQIGLASNWGQATRPIVNPESAKTAKPTAKPARVLAKIPVKILVDQAEPTVQKVWEKRLRQRIGDASAILERYCRVQLEVIEVGTWESDRQLTTLTELFDDFEHKVAVKPARLAIGFTGLLPPKKGDSTLGITPEPLHTHILIREWSLRSESDRLEVLLHELGHFLGACNSPEADSVMRSKVGDGRANHVSFRVGFDPLNTLVLNLVAEEFSRRPMRSLGDVTPETRKRLLEIFSTIAQVSADDPMAPRAIHLLGGTPPVSLVMRELPAAILDGAQKVVAAVVSAAERNERLPARDGVVPGEPSRRTSDALTAHYFQVAAAASRHLPAEQAAPAYLLGLAIALDRSSLLRAMPLRGIAWDKIETDTQRVHRLRVLGEPTMHGQARLAQYFVVSAALTMVVEGQKVSPGGILEELLRIRGEKHWRFDDLSANLAGITFALQLDASPGLFPELATSFRVAEYTLAPATEAASLTFDEFVHEYGSITDERFLSKVDSLRKRLLALPGYQLRHSEK